MGIFAGVLKQILQHHQNDPQFRNMARSDPLWYPLRAINVLPAVIERLKKAADSDQYHATLNPIDFENLLKTLNLKPEDKETQHLQAALIAQGIEIFLTDRMKHVGYTHQDASEIAEVVYDSLLAHFDTVYSRTKGVRGWGPQDQADQSAAVDAIMDLADQAAAMIQNMYDARLRQYASAERFWHTVALAAYREVIAQLRPLDPTLADQLQSFADTL